MKKPVYEFNKSSAIKASLVLIFVLILTILQIVLTIQENAMAKTLYGLIVGVMIFPILRITKWSWEPVFKKVKDE